MNISARLLLTTIFVLCTIASLQAQTPTARDSMIVSTDWLAKNLNDDSLVLLHLGDPAEYASSHIPRAQLVPMNEFTTPRGQGLTLELPPVDQLKATLEKLGVSNNSRIVIYFAKDSITPTARIFFTLDYLGLGDRTSILDGGLPAWRAANKPITAEVVQPKHGSFTPRVNSKLVVNADWVKENIANANVKILDARAPQFYTGAEAGRMPRAGRIPSAQNIPFSSLVEEGTNKFKSPTALRELFSAAEVKPKTTVATYCHIGQQASLLYFVARYLGYDAHLYDGSFEEWSNKAELPVEKK